MLKRTSFFRRSTKPIRRVSKKRAREARIYSEKRKAFLAAHPICQVWLKESGIDEQCALKNYSQDERDALGAPRSVDIHHMKGRGRYYLDETTWLAVSREAHERIGREPKWAEAQGYLDPRRNVRSSLI